MNARVKSAKPGIVHLIGYFKRLFNNPRTIPDTNAFDQSVSELIRQTERMTIIFQAVRNGLNQSNTVAISSFGYRKLNWLDWMVGIISFMNWSRGLILIFTSSERIAIFLGHPLFRAKDRQALTIWAVITLSVMFIFREWILSLEAKGKLEILSVWKVCCNGFNRTQLKMGNLHINRFRLTIILVTIVAYCVMPVVPLFTLVGFFTPVLTNPWMYEIPELAFSCFLGSFSCALITTFLLNSILGFTWYFICTLVFHLYRLMDLLDRAGRLKKSTRGMNERNIKLLCLLIIRRLNSFELTTRKLRYVFLYYFFVFASSGDVYIFLGLVVRIYNDVLANILALIGTIILPAIGIFGYIFGNFLSELDELTVRLHHLTSKNRLSLKTLNKVSEIMDRVAGPYNGIKLGDFLTIEKSFFIFFILENISTLMLFTCNIGPLIN
uniref:Odorant receptor n=1 Tax=Tetranychus urticae TaxID=32264 RepID=T1KWT1_TETUR